MNNSTKFISLGDHPPFFQWWQAEFKLKWDVTGLKKFGSVPAILIFRPKLDIENYLLS